MKKIMMIACLTLLGAITVQAQGKHHKGSKKTAEERAKYKTERMKDSLDLSAEQTETIMQINLDAEKKKDEIKAKYDNDKENVKKEMREVNKDRIEKIKAVLTPEQKEKLKKMKGDRKHNDRKGGHKTMKHQSE